MSDTSIKEEHMPPKGKLVNLRTLFSFIFRHKPQLFAALFFLFVASGTVLIVPRALGNIIDEGFFSENADSMDGYLLVFMAIVVVMATATALRFYFVTWLGERVVADIRSEVYNRLVTLSPAFFDENRPSEIVSRLTADTTLVLSIVGSSMSIWARNVLTAVGGTIWLFHLSPQMMSAIAIGIPITIVMIVMVGRRVRKLSRSSQDRVADVGAKAGESLAALPIVQAFTQEKTESQRFSTQVELAFGVAKKRILVRAALTFMIIFMVLSGIAAIIFFGVQDVLSGRMTGGNLAEFLILAMIVSGSYAALSEVYGDLQRAAGAAGRLAELLGSESPIQAPSNPAVITDPKAALRFDEVTFAYPSRPKEKALDDFSLSIEPGESVALVGPSGAGKSTIMQLTLRFYDPQFGKIFFSDHELRTLDPVDLRRHISFVPQDTVIFADTIAENIRYGRLDASDDEVREAAKAAAALDFIEAAEDGFNTFLGERGGRLSGGQRQRIAIARAILRDAPLLLLDEATSALDAESESKVQEALEHLMKGRTTLVIAHRLATVKNADRIIVMDNGRIVSEGTHTSLTKQDGLYRRLAELQFAEGASVLTDLPADGLPN